ncbi:MAG: hypothetical protein M1510_13550 [Nitrospirae bacterium]|nr:hypothetical protein [Nitrospirota bacterium]MCL5238218.1 hypothetical protein [Nitrospirota bacterium]
MRVRKIKIGVSPLYALDTSIDSGETLKADKEQSQSLKKSNERKESAGKKSTRTSITGLDRQDQEAIKAIGQAMSQAGADVTLPLEAVFIDPLHLCNAK